MSLDNTYRGLRVIDLSENIAGPLACMILGDLGADVVKIERPGAGEATRSLPPRWGAESTVFLTVNRNKRSVALDLRGPAGRDAVLRIARDADVVVESFRPGVADRLGLGFEDFRAVAPGLVHCSISAFGELPLGHDRPGFDALIQAFTGIMEMTGAPDGGPTRAAPSIVDISTGLWATTSIMAALTRRAETAEAQQLDISLVDCGFFLLCHQIMGYLGTGSFPPRLGAAAPSTAPYDAFRTADGTIMIAAATDRLYTRLCHAIDLPELADDARFQTVEDRVAARQELTELLQQRLRTANSEHWLGALGNAGVPAGPVNDLKAALAHPVTVERGIIQDSAEGAIPALKQVRLPLDTEDRCPMTQPPGLGQHTTEVLAEMGFSTEEIDELDGSSATERTVR